MTTSTQSSKCRQLNYIKIQPYISADFWAKEKMVLSDLQDHPHQGVTELLDKDTSDLKLLWPQFGHSRYSVS